MPIISFNISANLKKFLKKMVQQNEYKNSSTIIRDALVRLMNEKDMAITGDIDVENMASLNAGLFLPKLTSSVLITIRNTSPKIEKKLHRLELNYHDTILHKSMFKHNDEWTIMYVLEDTMNNIQMFIAELNGFEELQSFRYIINEPEPEEE